MYDMYPDLWTATETRTDAAAAKPRRRARQPHSVLPEVIVHLQQTDQDPGPARRAER